MPSPTLSKRGSLFETYMRHQDEKREPNLAGDHFGDDVASVDVDGYQCTENSASQLGQFTSYECRQLVEVLHTKQQTRHLHTSSVKGAGTMGRYGICPTKCQIGRTYFALPLLSYSKKGKGFPYSLPSIGSGVDPSVQAVSPQVTISHPPGGRLPLLSARPAVTFPVAQHHRSLAGIKLYCLVAEAHSCEQLA